MNANDGDLDRSEAATPYKLQKARDRGQVARSADLASAGVLLAAMVYAYWRGWEDLTSLLARSHRLLAAAGQGRTTSADFAQALQGLAVEVMTLLAPFFAVLVVTAVLASMLQTGPVLAAESLKPDWSRLHPMTGLRRMFNRRVPYDLVRSLLKLAVIVLVGFAALNRLGPAFVALLQAPPRTQLAQLHAAVAATGLQLAAGLVAIAILDLGFTRWEFLARMRMSRKEVTDEHKHREGDPRIKRRIRELRRQMLKRTQALRRTAQADVVITNPTHYAVALRYVESEMAAPRVVAKGTGFLARAIRQIAALHGVSIVRNPPLARKLFHDLEVDQTIPPDTYGDVARILVWVLARRRGGGGGAP